MKLKNETMLDLDHEDLAALLTEGFCGSYSKFEKLHVECVTTKDDGRTFTLTMTPNPEAEVES